MCHSSYIHFAPRLLKELSLYFDLHVYPMLGADSRFWSANNREV